jgi:hypothetical protein
MDVNGSAIYGTSPAPEVETASDANFAFYATKQDSHIFLHVVKWPEVATATIRIHRKDLKSAAVLDPKLKGFRSKSSAADGVTTLELQKPETIDPYATVIRLDFKTE